MPGEILDWVNDKVRTMGSCNLYKPPPKHIFDILKFRCIYLDYVDLAASNIHFETKSSFLV